VTCQRWGATMGVGLLVTAAAFCLPACSGAKAGSGSASTSAAQAHSPAASSSATSGPVPNVNAQLLQLSDLPTGWSVDNSSDSGSSTPECFKNATNFKSSEKAKAEAKFQDGSNGVPALDDEVVYMPGRAQTTMQAFSQLMAGCGQISISAGGHPFKGTIGQMSFPTLGVQTQAYQMNLSTNANGLNITIGYDFAVARFANDEILVFAYGDLGTPDITQVQQLASKAAAKVSTS
jgi:hypothetical protein